MKRERKRELVAAEGERKRDERWTMRRGRRVYVERIGEERNDREENATTEARWKRHEGRSLAITK